MDRAGKKKRHSTQKESLQGGHTSGVNYKSNTLSVAQKRRSFNQNDIAMMQQ